MAGFLIRFPSDNREVLLGGDGALVLEDDAGPLAFWQDRPRQPGHIEAEVLEFPQMDIGADRTALQGTQELLGLGFNDGSPKEWAEGGIARGPQPSFLGGSLFGGN